MGGSYARLGVGSPWDSALPGLVLLVLKAGYARPCLVVLGAGYTRPGFGSPRGRICQALVVLAAGYARLGFCSSKGLICLG
jgi:hypothetical protein